MLCILELAFARAVCPFCPKVTVSSMVRLFGFAEVKAVADSAGDVLGVLSEGEVAFCASEEEC